MFRTGRIIGLLMLLSICCSAFVGAQDQPQPPRRPGSGTAATAPQPGELERLTGEVRVLLFFQVLDIQAKQVQSFYNLATQAKDLLAKQDQAHAAAYREVGEQFWKNLVTAVKGEQVSPDDWTSVRTRLRDVQNSDQAADRQVGALVQRAVPVLTREQRELLGLQTAQEVATSLPPMNLSQQAFGQFMTALRQVRNVDVASYRLGREQYAAQIAGYLVPQGSSSYTAFATQVLRIMDQLYSLSPQQFAQLQPTLDDAVKSGLNLQVAGDREEMTTNLVLRALGGPAMLEELTRSPYAVRLFEEWWGARVTGEQPATGQPATPPAGPETLGPAPEQPKPAASTEEEKLAKDAAAWDDDVTALRAAQVMEYLALTKEQKQQLLPMIERYIQRGQQFGRSAGPGGPGAPGGGGGVEGLRQLKQQLLAGQWSLDTGGRGALQQLMPLLQVAGVGTAFAQQGAVQEFQRLLTDEQRDAIRWTTMFGPGQMGPAMGGPGRGPDMAAARQTVQDILRQVYYLNNTRYRQMRYFMADQATRAIVGAGATPEQYQAVMNVIWNDFQAVRGMSEQQFQTNLNDIATRILQDAGATQQQLQRLSQSQPDTRIGQDDVMTPLFTEATAKLLREAVGPAGEPTLGPPAGGGGGGR